LNAGGAGLIAGAIAAFPEDVAPIALVAEFCGLSEATVMNIFATLARGGGASLEPAIDALCDAMGAC
jgi:hypothetical protein